MAKADMSTPLVTVHDSNLIESDDIMEIPNQSQAFLPNDHSKAAGLYTKSQGYLPRELL